MSMRPTQGETSVDYLRKTMGGHRRLMVDEWERKGGRKRPHPDRRGLSIGNCGTNKTLPRTAHHNSVPPSRGVLTLGLGPILTYTVLST